MWVKLTSVTATNNSDVIVVNVGSTVGIKIGDALLLAGFIVEISGVFANELQVRLPWPHESVQLSAVVIPTFGDFNEAVREIRMLKEATVNNYAEMDAFWSKLGEVTFKSHSGQEFTFKTARQTIDDLSEIESQMNDASETALNLIAQYDEQLGAAYQRVIAARDDSERSSQTASEKAQIATQQAQQTEQDALATSQDRAAVSELAQQVSSNAQSASEDKQAAQAAAQTATQQAQQTEQDALATSQDRTAVSELAQQVSLNAQSASEDKQAAQAAAQTATQKAEQTEQDALATSQDRAAVSGAKLSVDENAQLVSEKSMLVEQLASQTAQNAQVATEQATIAMEQADRAEALVDAATGGSLLKEANLSDLNSTTEARANLSVYSQQQVDNRLAKKVDAIALETNASTFTYENSKLTQQVIEHGDGQEIITYTYTNNVLTQAVSVRNGVTKTTTYTYTDGRLIGVTTA